MRQVQNEKPSRRTLLHVLTILCTNLLIVISLCKFELNKMKFIDHVHDHEILNNKRKKKTIFMMEHL